MEVWCDYAGDGGSRVLVYDSRLVTRVKVWVAGPPRYFDVVASSDLSKRGHDDCASPF